MFSKIRLGVIVFIVLVCVPTLFAATLGESVEGLASNIVANQEFFDLPEWQLIYWPDEEDFGGTIVQGLICAYDYIGDPNYSYSATRGAAYIYTFPSIYVPFGDAVLAFAQLGTSGIGSANLTDSADAFFVNIHLLTPGGAASYISDFYEGDISSAVFYVSQLTMAAYLVDNEDKALWRQGLIDTLGLVDDESAYFPVQAIGIATWALAETGPLDDTLIVSDANDPIWGEVTLADLPGILQEHQVPQGEDDAGSFYWRLDHTDGGSGGPVGGYFEDTLYCTQGLYSAAAQSTTQAAALEDSIVDGVKAILSSLAVNGMVHEHLALGGQTFLMFDAELVCFVDILGLDPNLDLDDLANVSGYDDLGIGSLLGD